MAEYKYSSIEEVQVKNFRGIGEIAVNWRESPIVCLIGENEACKTSFNMAVAVLAGHKNPREQLSYIREGTNGFGIRLSLSDGHQILRLKTKDINGYTISKDGMVEYQTSKLGEGLPVQVSDLMGIIEEKETGEFLQFRTYEDNVLFAYTTASANYKMIYGALKVEQLTKAVRIGNDDVNYLRSENERLSIAEGTVIGQIKSINVIDTSSIEKVRNRIEGLLETVKNIDGLISTLDNLNKMNEYMRMYKGLECVKPIDIHILDKLNGIINLYDTLHTEIPDTSGIEYVKDTDRRLFEKAKETIRVYEYLNNDMKVFNGLESDGISTISIDTINKFSKLIKILDDIEVESETLRTAEIELQGLEDEHKAILEELSKNNINVVACPRCGEIILFNSGDETV